MKRLIIGFLTVLGSITLILVLGVVGVGYWLTRDSDQSSLPQSFVLEVDLRQDLPLAHIQSPLGFIDQAPLTLDDLILKLKAAEADERVKGLLIRIAETNHGFARAQELHDAINRFKASGKATAAWADSFGELTPGNEGYYIASAADQVVLQPSGYVGLTGISFEIPFFRKLLNEVGIEPVLFRRSEFKTAFDSFVDEGISSANELMMTEISNELYEQLATGVAEARDLPVEAIYQAIDQAPLAAEAAIEAGLLDRLAYWSEFRADFQSSLGDQAGFVQLAGYDRQFGFGVSDDSIKIGVVSLSGGVIRGDGNFGAAIAADPVLRTFAQVSESDADVVVLRIDTGGGSAVASETIAFELRQLVENGTPVIVSMANAAASGGYWIAAEGTRIIAWPATFTGSIGVIAGKPIVANLLAKAGIEVETISQGQFADLWSLTQNLEPQQAVKLDATVNQIYERFKTHVAENRQLSGQQIEDVAKGRVWLGGQSIELGLVDRLGGLNVAIEEAVELAGGNEQSAVRLERFPRQKPWSAWLDELLNKPLDLVELRLKAMIGLRSPGSDLLNAQVPTYSN